jgi:hypothetical protein
VWVICDEALPMPAGPRIALVDQKTGNPLIAFFSMDWMG